MSSRFDNSDDQHSAVWSSLGQRHKQLDFELVNAEVELVAVGDVNGDRLTDFALSTQREIEFSFTAPDGSVAEWSSQSDRDFLVLGGEDETTALNLNRLIRLPDSILETRPLGDINGDGFNDFATVTAGGEVAGYYGLPVGFYGVDAPGFYGQPVDDVYITFGGRVEPAESLAKLYGVDGNVVTVKSLGDVNKDGVDDFAVSTGSFSGYYADIPGIPGGVQSGIYARDIDDTFVVLGGNEPTPPIALSQFVAHGKVIDVQPLGDLNGDGVDDLGLVVGGYYGLDQSGGYYGKVIDDVLALFGELDEPKEIASLAKLIGTEERVVGAEVFDFNGDGISDLGVLVGGYYGAPSGFYGREVSDVVLLMGGEDASPVSLGRFAGEGRTASAVYDLGDINGDGFNDIGIGVSQFHGDDGSGRGYYGSRIEDVLVQFGNDAGKVELSELKAFIQTDEALHGASRIGDINGDGFDDLAVSCGYYGGNVFSDLLVVLGGRDAAEGSVLFNNLDLPDDAFANVKAIGDANADGFADFSVGGFYGVGYYGGSGGYYGDYLGISSYVVYGGDSSLGVSTLAKNGRIANGDIATTVDLELLVGDLGDVDDGAFGP